MQEDSPSFRNRRGMLVFSAKLACEMCMPVTGLAAFLSLNKALTVKCFRSLVTTIGHRTHGATARQCEASVSRCEARDDEA